MQRNRVINNKNSTRVLYNLLIAIPVILLPLIFILNPTEDYLLFRGHRVLVSFVFIGASIYLFGKKLNLLVYLFMLCYGLSSIAAIFFENNTIGILCMLINFVAFTFLIRMLYLKINFKSINPSFLVAIIFGIIANIWLVYYLLMMLFEIHNSPSLFIAICISTIGSFSLCVLALFYNYQSKTATSILFTLFIIILVFSETFRGAGHYGVVDQDVGQLFARVLLLVAYLLLFSFSFREVFRKDKDFLL